MASLAQLDELVGFFSYSREDDEDFRGSFSALRDTIQRELSTQLGRTRRNFRLWQDQEAIAPGKDWEAEITKAVERSEFFIPIVTPRAVRSDYCKFEFASFVAREGALGRGDLVFPILWISVPALLDETQWRDDPVLSIVAKRQYVDWRSFRYVSVDTPAFGQAIDRYCGKIVDTLREPWLSPEERVRQEAEAKRRAEDQERVRQEAEAKRQTEERERLRKGALSKKRAEEEAREREEAERQRWESEAKNRAEGEERARQQAERSMASLAQLDELVGFFSYSREDDEDFRGSLSALRDTIQRDLRAQLGRSRRNFRLWQDQEAIAPGKLWESEFAKAVGEAVFFIPIVTPRAVASKYCKFEFEFVPRARARAGPQRSRLPDPVHSGSRVAGRGGVARRSGAVGRRQTPICRLALLPLRFRRHARLWAGD